MQKKLFDMNASCINNIGYKTKYVKKKNTLQLQAQNSFLFLNIVILIFYTYYLYTLLTY